MSDKVFWLSQKKKKTSHVLHLLLSILTAGAWVIVWIICGLSNSIENRRIDRLITEEMAK